MILNYFKAALRNLLKNKFYALINIVGLAVGLTVGILILLWADDELNFDLFNKKYKQIYRIEAKIGTGTSQQIWSGVPAPIAYHAIREIPGVKKAVRIEQGVNYSVYKYKDKSLNAGDQGAVIVDSSIFKVFDFKLLKGNVNKPFLNAHSVVISERTAARFFGKEEPMGKVLLADSKDAYTVTGLMANLPENSSIKADMFFPSELAESRYNGKGMWKSRNEDWGNYRCDTYFLLQPGVSAQSVANLLTKLDHTIHPESQGTYIAQGLEKMHLFKADGSEGGIEVVNMFVMVAILILLIACINYVNLSTARALQRSKEVSLRKIIGAERSQLFLQFIIETAMFFGIALLLALLMIPLLMPLYNQVSAKHMQFSIKDPRVWQVVGITLVCTMAISSIYPALLLSSFKPIEALKGKMGVGLGGGMLRRGLVVCQFVFSAGLIMGTSIISRQLNYMQQKDLGYDKSFVFSFAMRDMQKNYEALRTELLGHQGIQDVSRSGDDPVLNGSATTDTEWDKKDPKRSFLIHQIGVDKNYLSFFKLQLQEGEGFKGLKSDTANYILNETAVREAGIENPIGKRFKLHELNGRIIGVLKDFHFASLKQKVEPAILYYAPQDCWRMFIRTTGKEAPRAVQVAGQLWKKVNPGFPFDYQFLDATYDQLYKTEQRQSALFSCFTLVAILISCLGLLGLATYTSQVRVKEIGIRKVLGASAARITFMLSKDFLLLVLIALGIAIPLAGYLMNNWLQEYAYRIHIQWWIFALTGLLVMLIALMTISFQAAKAALTNPVKSLRSE